MLESLFRDFSLMTGEKIITMKGTKNKTSCVLRALRGKGAEVSISWCFSMDNYAPGRQSSVVIEKPTGTGRFSHHDLFLSCADTG